MNARQPVLHDKVCADKIAAVKKRAEDLAMQLVESGLVTDDPALASICERLRPFQAKLGKVSRTLVRQGLALVTVEEPFADEEDAAKACLVALLDKLDSMKSMFGIS